MDTTSNSLTDASDSPFIDTTDSPFAKPTGTGIPLEPTTAPIKENTTSHAKDVDRAAERAAARRRRYLTIMGYLLTAIGCLAIGAFWARQRYRAQKIIVSINGHVITQDEFYHRLEVNGGLRTLQTIAEETLTQQYARKMGVTVTDAEVEARYKTVSGAPDFPRYLANTHQSVEDVHNALRAELTVNKVLGRKVQVSEADVALYYKFMTDRRNPIARFYTPPSVTIAVIVSRDRNRILKSSQEAENGTSFADLVTRYSEDAASKAKGGELPPIMRGRTTFSKVPGMEDRLFGLKAGEVTGPVASGRQWLLIRCLKKTPEVIPPREQVDYECRVGAMMSRLPKTALAEIQADYQKFKQSANIHTFRPEYTLVFGDR